MKEYLRERQRQESTSRFMGIILTVAAHVAALVLVSFTGIKYIYPPPPETTFLMEVEEDVIPPKPITRGHAPRSESVDRDKSVELVQKSESPNTVTKENLTPETKQDDFGDVETPAPEQKEEPVLDARAAFPGMAKKDTTITAPHSAREAGETFKAGQTEGNTAKGKADGKPNAHLKGRSTVGNLPSPSYTVQESGIVVVSIWVDQYGTVKKAVPGADGTTVTNTTLWNAARNAAMGAHFNTSAEAPAMQEGTITYIFKLK